MQNPDDCSYVTLPDLVRRFLDLPALKTIKVGMPRPVVRRGLGIVVNVELGDVELAAELLGDFLEDGRFPDDHGRSDQPNLRALPASSKTPLSHNLQQRERSAREGFYS